MEGFLSSQTPRHAIPRKMAKYRLNHDTIRGKSQANRKGAAVRLATHRANIQRHDSPPPYMPIDGAGGCMYPCEGGGMGGCGVCA
jgi:hypothetical protein